MPRMRIDVRCRPAARPQRVRRPSARRLLWALLLVCSPPVAAAGAGAPGAAPATATYDSRVAALLARLQGDASPAEGAGAESAGAALLPWGVATFEGGTSVGLLVEGSVTVAALEAAGAQLGASVPIARPGRGPWIHTVRLPLGKVGALLELPGVARVEAAGPHRLHLDVSLPEVRAQLVHDGTGTPPVYAGRTGQGVVVGVVDSGIDPLHQDFRDGAGAARIESAWDQNDDGASPGPPAGFGYGTFWSGATLAAGTARLNDTDGHGTHVTGIAAGSGRATANGKPAYRFIGMAPEATIVSVKTDLTDGGIVDGVDFVFQRATLLGLPAVVNLSLGSQYGPHDGSSAMEVSLDALSGPGRVVVVSAGNDGSSTLHAEGNAIGGAALTLSIPTYTEQPGTQNDYVLISAWAPDANNVSVRVQGPGGGNVGPVAEGFASGVSSVVDGRIEVFNGTGGPAPNGMREILIQIYDLVVGQPPNDGTWTLTFTATTGTGTAEVDAWMFQQLLGGAPRAQFVNGLDVDEVVASPGTAGDVVTVASYVTKRSWLSFDGNTYSYGPSLPTVGVLSPFSSHGPRRDGALKPDIAAPGQGIFSALSAAMPRNANVNVFVEPDERHILLQGTSQAAPHVTGLVALMMEVFPNLSPQLAKDYLACAGRADANTGTLPNVAFGHGKIDALDATSGCLVPTVSLLDFAAQPVEQGVLVRWSLPVAGTLTQLRLERRDGDESFTLVQTVPARVGEGQLLDPLPLAGTRRYRMLGSAPGVSEQWLGEIVVERGAALPARVALLPNVPNPFNPSTVVPFALPRAAQIELAVFDARGRRVRTLLQGPQPAGHHSAVFDGLGDDGRRLASGVYHVRLSAEGTVRSHAVTLTK